MDECGDGSPVAQVLQYFVLFVDWAFTHCDHCKAHRTAIWSGVVFQVPIFHLWILAWVTKAWECALRGRSYCVSGIMDGLEAEDGEKVRLTIPLYRPLPEASAHEWWGPAWVAVGVVLVPELSCKPVIALALHEAGSKGGSQPIPVVHLAGGAEAQVSEGAQAWHQLYMTHHHINPLTCYGDKTFHITYLYLVKSNADMFWSKTQHRFKDLLHITWLLLTDE